MKGWIMTALTRGRELKYFAAAYRHSRAVTALTRGRELKWKQADVCFIGIDDRPHARARIEIRMH